VPIRHFSPMIAPLTSRSWVRRFSPNSPGGMARPSWVAHPVGVLGGVGVDRLVGPAVVAVELAVAGQTGDSEFQGSVNGLLVDRGVVEIARMNAVNDVDGQQPWLACHAVRAGQALLGGPVGAVPAPPHVDGLAVDAEQGANLGDAPILLSHPAQLQVLGYEPTCLPRSEAIKAVKPSSLNRAASARRNS
jgi:hypothetical protein